jgi:hypothetical protein
MYPCAACTCFFRLINTQNGAMCASPPPRVSQPSLLYMYLNFYIASRRKYKDKWRNRRKPAIWQTIRKTAKQHSSMSDRVNSASLIILNNIYVLPNAIFQKLLLPDPTMTLRPVKQKKACFDMLYY